MSQIDYLLKLDSTTLSNSQQSHNFEVFYQDPIPIPDTHNWSIGLQKLNAWYSYYNIDATLYNNNQLDYSPDSGSTWKNIIISPGAYTIDDLNDYLHAQMKLNGDYTVVNTVDTFDIHLTPNYNTLKLIIEVTNNYQLDISQSNIYLLFGWSSQIVTTTGEGTSNVDITSGVNTLMVHCDVCTGSYENQQASDVVYSMIPQVPPGANIYENPNNIIYLPLRQ